MTNAVFTEYQDLIKRLEKIQSKVNLLPQGYISKKNIKGKQYFYLQNRENGKVKSRYLKEDEIEDIVSKIELSKRYKLEIPQIKNRLLELEKAAKLIDKRLSRELMVLKLSANMDFLTDKQKDKSISFANAMNSIEGVNISNITENKISDWKNGNKQFLNLFNETLTKSEADITNLAMLAIYNRKYEKFDTNTLLDIHFNIFGQIYDWAGEIRTIQIVKYEDVLGGDTVRYTYPKEIKKELNAIMKEIPKLKRTGTNDKEIVFKLVRIISNIWQIHPFREGNTRTVIVFSTLLAKSLGLDVKHELFKVNSAYVRNAFVWASQGIYSKYEYLERIFFEAMLSGSINDDMQKKVDSKYEMIGDYNIKDYTEKPHEYASDT